MSYRLIRTKDGEFHLMGTEYLKRVKGQASYGISCTGRCIKWDVNKAVLWGDPYMVLATTKETADLPRLNSYEITRLINDQALAESMAKGRYDYYDFHPDAEYNSTDDKRDAFVEGYMEGLKERDKRLSPKEILEFVDKYVNMKWHNKSEKDQLAMIGEFMSSRPNDQWECEVFTAVEAGGTREEPKYWTPDMPIPYVHNNFITIKRIIR